MGQFFGLDPLETPNRYQYADANPVNKVDPTGLDPCYGNKLCDGIQKFDVIITQDGTVYKLDTFGYTTVPSKPLAVSNWPNTLAPQPIPANQGFTHIAAVEANVGSANSGMIGVAFDANAVTYDAIAQQFRGQILGLWGTKGFLIWADGFGNPLPLFGINQSSTQTQGSSSPATASTAAPDPQPYKSPDPSQYDQCKKTEQRNGCKIEVLGYPGLASSEDWGIYIGFYHLFIEFTDRNGNLYHYRGGRKGTCAGVRGETISTFGGEVRGFLADSPDLEPYTRAVARGQAVGIPILAGDAVCDMQSCFEAETIRIRGLCKPYGINNSNTVASTLLSKCGCPVQKPNVSAPGWGRKDLM